MDSGAKEKAVRGVAWSSVANWGCQLLSFGVYTGLARILNPHAFGIVALAGVYIAFIQIFVTQGFGAAIIQRRDLKAEHLDSAFWIAMATAAIFSLVSILFAGLIAHFFREPAIAPVIRWLSFSILFYALSSIPTAILTRELDFRALAIRSLGTTGLGGAVGLAMAMLGWGFWSLVGQQLVGAISGCLCLWFAVPWRPRLRVSKPHLRDLYGFSLSLTGNDILWFFSQRSDQTMVGYGFGSLVLGPYSLASKVTTLVYDGVVGPFQSVAFPAFSKLQSEPLRLERVLHRFCEMSSFLCLPLFVGLAVVAPELIPLLFGAKWIAAIPLLQILSFYGAVRVVLAFMHPLMLAKGRAGLYLLMNVVLSILTLSGCLLAVRWSPQAIALSTIVSLLAFLIIFLGVAHRALEFKALTLLRSFAFPVLCCLLMMIAVGGVRNFVNAKVAPAAALALCVLAGVLTYVSSAYLLRREVVKEICEMARNSLIPSRWRRGLGPSRIKNEKEKTTAESVQA
jgi:O-antigen/teichoic acid export membrane protein